jgi:hypothetical protein
MRLVKLALVTFLGLSLSSGAVWAQDPDDDEEDTEEGEEGEDEDEGEEGEEGDEGDGEGDSDADGEGGEPAMEGSGVGPFTKEGYPQAVVWRPQTLPSGTIQVSGGYQLVHLQFCFGDVCAGATSGGLFVEGTYAVMDKLQLRLNTGITIHDEFDWSGFGIGGDFSLVDTEKLDLALVLDIPFEVCDGCDFFSGFSVGLATRFVLSDKLYIYGGSGRASGVGRGLGVGELVNIGTTGDFSLVLNVGAGVGFQATPELAIALGTTLFQIALAPDSDAAFIFADFIPLELRALFSLNNKMDILGGISFIDLKGDAGNLFFDVGINFRI